MSFPISSDDSRPTLSLNIGPSFPVSVLPEPIPPPLVLVHVSCVGGNELKPRHDVLGSNLFERVVCVLREEFDGELGIDIVPFPFDDTFANDAGPTREVGVSDEFPLRGGRSTEGNSNPDEFTDSEESRDSKIELYFLDGESRGESGSFGRSGSHEIRNVVDDRFSFLQLDGRFRLST